MEYVKALEYFAAIDVIEAQGYLVDMQIMDYPRAKADGRKKLHRAMTKMAYPEELKKPMSFEDFARKMNGR